MQNAKKKKVIDIYPPHTLEKKEKKLKQEEHVLYQEKEENIMIRIESTPLPMVEEEPEKTSLEEEKIIKGPEIYEAPFQAGETRIKTKRKKLFNIILPLVFLGLFYYLGFVVLTKAEVVINSKKLTLSIDSDGILIDKNITEANYSQKVIPGNLFIFSENDEKEFKSTGQGKDEQMAKGIITIINNFSSAPQILVANTRFETPDGKIFRLDSRIVIPGATMKNGKLEPSSIDVNVTAATSGPEYNIIACNDNCKFTIPGFKGTS